jgi:hypothetical protein
MPRVLPFLLRKSDEGGGGDLDPEDFKYAGRWAGDRIVCIGDYDSSNLFAEAEEKYKDISEEVREEYNSFIELEDLMLFSSLEEKVAHNLKRS